MEQTGLRFGGKTRWLSAIAVVVCLLANSTLAATSEQAKQETAEHYRQATAAFGLGDYAAAASHYEQAFALTPDHALLFNAALSHERAGNADRARTLFANYLRLFAKGEKAADARRHLEATSPKPEEQPATDVKEPTAAIGGIVPVPTPAPDPPPPTLIPATPPVEKAAPINPPPKSLWRNPWLWGAAAVVVGAVGIGFALSRSQPENTPLWGRI